MAYQIANNSSTTTINTANTALDGSGSITPLFMASGLNGSMLQTIRIESNMAIQAGMIRIFLKSNVPLAPWTLLKEVVVPETPLNDPPYPTYNVTLQINLEMASGWSIGVSTQINDTFLINAFGYDITGFI